MRRPLHLDVFSGPPVTLPRLLDHLSERWWSLPPRARAVSIGVAVVGLVLAGLSHAAATPYGPPTRVLIADRDLPVGHELTGRDLQRTTWPADLVPDDALSEPTGRLTVPLTAQAVATQRHVAADGLASELRPDTAAVPIPSDALPALTIGSRIEVVGRDLDGRSVVLARDALVLAVDGTDVWLAVPRGVAPDVAAAGASGLVTVVLLPP